VYCKITEKEKGAEESAERLRSVRPEGGRGAQELQDLLPSADRETVGGVGDDVRVCVVAQVEADGDPPRAGPRRVGVGNRRHARGVRVADGYLDATALVHEACLRLLGEQQFDGRGHFFAAAVAALCSGSGVHCTGRSI